MKHYKTIMSNDENVNICIYSIRQISVVLSLLARPMAEKCNGDKNADDGLGELHLYGRAPSNGDK